MNILASCLYCTVDLLKVDDKTRETISKEFNVDADNTMLSMSEEDIKEFNIDYSAIDPKSYEFDEYILEDILTTMLGKHPYYLVYAKGCKWNGASGYTFCTDIKNTVSRGYEISLETQEEITDRAIKCIESSHDVPNGGITIIVGISNKEYKKLENADFNKIEEFVFNIFK